MLSTLDRLDALLSYPGPGWDEIYREEVQYQVNKLKPLEWEFLYDTWHIRPSHWLESFSGILQSSVPAQLHMIELMLENGFYGDGTRILLEELALNRDYIPPKKLLPRLRELLIMYKDQSDKDYIEELIKLIEE